MTLRAHKPAHEFSEPISQWTKAPIKRYARLQGGFAFKSEMFSTNGVPVVRMNNLKRGNLDLTEVARVPEQEAAPAFALRDGDLLIGMSGSIGQTGSLGNFAVVKQSDLPCQLNQRVGRFISTSGNLYYPYLLWIIQSAIFSDSIILNSTGTAQFNVSSEQIGQISAPFPPFDAQVAIANFLYSEIDKIDCLISKQAEFLTRLEEYRRALITQVVTCGLDASMHLKATGLHWLETIPEKWQIVPMKRVATLRYGLGQPPPEMVGGTPLLRATNITRGKITEAGLVFVDPDKVPKGRNAHLRSGEILVVRSGAYTGDSAIVTRRYENAVAGYDVVVTPKGIEAHFLAWQLLASHILEYQFELVRARAAQPHLNVEDLGETQICLPPLSVQRAIVVFIESRMAAIDSLVNKQRELTTCLRERRNSLIAEALMGHIDRARSPVEAAA